MPDYENYPFYPEDRLPDIAPGQERDFPSVLPEIEKTLPMGANEPYFSYPDDYDEIASDALDEY